MFRSASRALLALILTISVIPTVARAQAINAAASNSTVSAAHATLDDFLSRASGFEDRRLWQQAADVYERAIRFYPQEPALKTRWQKAERLYSLSRRYNDPSYHKDLLALRDGKATDLYLEVLRKVQTHYVEAVDMERLVRLGYEHLDLALGEDLFIKSNAPGRVIPETTVAYLRGQCHVRPNHRIVTPSDAVEEVRRAGRMCTDHGFNNSAAVTMEFLTAACEGLDQYSTHLTPNRLTDLYAMIDGNFVGLGVEVRGDAQGLEIVNVLPESPAEESGVIAGEFIVAVDRHAITGLSTEEAANRLQGAAGTQVTLDLKSKEGGVRQAVVHRREVIVHSVTHAEILDANLGIGYIRLASFQKLTVRELDRAIGDLQRSGMQAMILDLRGNPGGLLDVAVQVADRFVDDGVIVSTQGRAWGQSWSHRAGPGPTWNFPLVILVDGDSASASEILAGAMKDHHRATIVGVRSYGKGSVQSIFPLRTANTGLRLTTAKFYSPNGKAFEGVGVVPDIIVPRATGAFGEESPLPRKPSLTDDVQLRRAYDVVAQVFANAAR